MVLAATVSASLAVRSARRKKPSANARDRQLVHDQDVEPRLAFDPTAYIAIRGIYETLFTYQGGELARPRPLLARSWTESQDAKMLTIELRQDVRFADGTPMTSADVVFSLRRLVNLRGNPAFLLAGVTVSGNGKRRRAALQGPSARVADDPRRPLDEHPQREARARARWNRRGERTRERSGGEVAQLGRLRGRRQRSVPAELVQPDIAGDGSVELQVLGGPKACVRQDRPPEHDRADPAVEVQRGSHEVALDLLPDKAVPLRSNQKLRVLCLPQP